MSSLVPHEVDVGNFKWSIDDLLKDKVEDCGFVTLEEASNAMTDLSYFGPKKDLDFLLQRHPKNSPRIYEGAFVFHDSNVSSGTLLVERNNSALIGQQTLPLYARKWIMDYYCDPSSSDFNPGFRRKGMIKNNVIKFNHPILVVTHCNLAYGHLLLEMLGRMYIARQLLDAGMKAKVIHPTKHVPPWFRTLFSLCFSPNESCSFDDENQAVYSETVIVPSMLMEEHLFSNAYNKAVKWFGDRAISSSEMPNKRSRLMGRKVFNSRASHKGQQGISNEAEVIEALEKCGFEIFEPQKHTMGTQVELFRNTSLLVSDYNSSLHNSIFMPEKTSVLMLNYFSRYQTGLCAVRRQKLGLFCPKDGNYRPYTLRGTPEAFYEVDVKALVEYLDQLEIYQ